MICWYITNSAYRTTSLHPPSLPITAPFPEQNLWPIGWGLRAVYALNVLERKRRPVVRPETFSQVPDDPSCDLFSLKREPHSNKGRVLASKALAEPEPLTPLFQY